jgi:hypothetical protein
MRERFRMKKIHMNMLYYALVQTLSYTNRARINLLIGRELTRRHITNMILEKMKKPRAYLEIGIREGETIASNIAEKRVGVDPKPQLEKIDPRFKKGLEGILFHKKTSDDFFKENTELFDVVLVDGLHLYEQAIKDILNAYNNLKEGGFIVVHDCNPTTERAAERKQSIGDWNGDVWKAIYDLKENYPEIKYVVLDTDQGLCIISKTDNKKYKTQYHKEYISTPYSELARRRNELLKLKPAKYIFKIIDDIPAYILHKANSIVVGEE